MVNRENNRPLRIGVLINQLEMKYMHLVWQAVRMCAAQLNIGLLAFVGRSLKSPYKIDMEQNFIYSFINRESVDGLIFVPSIGVYLSPIDYGMFMNHFSGIPGVSLSIKCGNIPAVLVDCAEGIKQAVEHCIIDHSYKRIAFIRGPVESSEADNRFLAYKDTLKKHNIPFDPHIVVEGNFVIYSGRKAARELLLTRKQKIDAIIASNDDMALGAMEVIRELGLKVPQDVAIIGVDDWEETEYHIPSISSIRQPLQEQVYEALKMLIAMIHGQSRGKDIVLPARFIKRYSCGCSTQVKYLQDEFIFRSEKALSDAGRTNQDIKRMNSLILKKCCLESEDKQLFSFILQKFLRLLIRFIESNSSEDDVLKAFSAILLNMDVKDRKLHLWLETFYCVQQNVLEFVPVTKLKVPLDHLFFKLKLIVTKFLESQQAVKRFALETRIRDLLSVSQNLITSFNFNDLISTITEQLPPLGIKSIYIFLFQEPITMQSEYFWEISGAVNILLAMKDGKLTRHTGSIFAADMVVPYILAYEDNKKDWILLPLVFAEEHFGVVLFEAALQEDIVYETLRMQISSAIKGVLLFEQQKHIEDELKKTNVELESLSLLDELTGLYNRRGFLTLSTQIWKMAQRSNMQFLIVFMDLDDLKQINDNFGHPEGDEILKAFAEILKVVFRRNDILSRIGGDEFVVLSYNASLEHKNKILQRIEKNIDHFNNSSGKSYKLSVSTGFSSFDHKSMMSIEDLMKKADKEQYINKSKKKKSTA